ncbi:MAG: Asp-tRNA(Asn)/Glu-tRNA(Gln) amidotransferase subunit GatC [Verrucomicrobiota bacterium]
MKDGAIDVGYVADLARIELTDEEKALFQKQLGDVLAYVKQLERIDISSIPETPVDPHLPTNVLRQDDVTESLPVQDALLNAPKQKDNLIVVPKIVE